MQKLIHAMLTCPCRHEDSLVTNVIFYQFYYFVRCGLDKL